MNNSHNSKKININSIPNLYYLKFLLLALGYGFNGTTFTSIPFLFYRAKLNCLQSDGQTSYQCSSEEACNNPYGYMEQTEYPQIQSIVGLFDLYCDRKILEAWMLTLGQFGKVLAYVILVFFPVSKKLKEYIIYTNFVVIGAVLCSLHFIQSTEMFVFAFFLWNMLFSVFYGLIYNHITDVYPYAMSENGSAYINTSWPSVMILFMAFSYFFGTWENILIHFTGIPLLIIGISSFILKFYMEKTPEYINFAQLVQEEQDEQQRQMEQNNHEESELNQNGSVIDKLKENYQAVKKNSALRKNLVIWTLGWTCNGLCYIGCYYQLNTLQGNLYFNNFMSTIFEVLASVLAVIFVKRLNLKNIIITTYFIIGIAFTSCIFVNGDLNAVQSVSSLIINLSPVVVAKVSYEIMWTVLVKYQGLVFHPKYHQIQFSFSNMVGMFICNCIPFYKYFMEQFSLSPFIGYGLFCLAASYYSTQYVEVGSQEKKEDLTSPLKKQEDFKSIELQELYDIDQSLNKVLV